jgi:glucose-1-phosphate thymidylyltransferase
MKALILAAGYATRLYPITKEYPKPLLRVGGKPIIEYILATLEAVEGIDEVFVVTNSKFFGQFRKWKKGFDSKRRITLVDDLTKNNSDRLGAIGDMNFVIKQKKINDDLLVVGGDNLFDGDLRNFLAAAKAYSKDPLIGVFDINNKAGARKYGVVQLNREKKIVSFQEKPQRPLSTLVAMCLYYFPKGRLKLIGAYLKQKEHKRDATGFYIDWLRKKVPVYGFVFHGRWYDIGDHSYFNKAKQQFAKYTQP